MKHYLLVALLFTAVSNAFAQPGTLDPTFNSPNGKVVLALAQEQGARAAVIQADGKIITGGFTGANNTTEFMLARFNPNGSLDSTFGDSGTVITSFGGEIQDIRNIVLQADGKIVAAGSFHLTNGALPDFAIARYNTDGSLDTTFDGDGKVIVSVGNNTSDRVNTVLVNSSGKIIVVGNSYDGNNTTVHDFSYVRLNANGTLDNTFNGTGKLKQDILNDDVTTGATLQPDGKIVTVGFAYTGVGNNRKIVITRHNTDGSIDTTFGTGGVQTVQVTAYDGSRTAIIQSDGKILVSGITFNGTNNNLALIRLKTDGTPDSTFSSDGKLSTEVSTRNDDVQAMLLQADGKILLGGSSRDSAVNKNNFALVRYNTDGSLDNGFGNAGIVITPLVAGNNYIGGLAWQNNKIIAAGVATDTTQDIAIARYLTGPGVGIIDFAIDNNSVLVYPNPVTQSISLEYTLTTENEILVYLTDMQGKTLATFVNNENQQAGEQKLNIDFPQDIPSGIYYVVIASPQGKVSVKVVK